MIEANVKTCKQCGELRPMSQYRKYYGGRKGTYNTCKVCEKVNTRAKYLRRKGEDMTEQEQLELDKIYKLYDLQRKAGLKPPSSDATKGQSLTDSLDDMLSKYTAQAAPVVQTSDEPVPAEIQQWMTEPLTEEPDYYLDEVYEDLKAKYRPQLRIDAATLQPVYDDTYRDALEWVLDRFNQYEDKYWDEEE